MKKSLSKHQDPSTTKWWVIVPVIGLLSLIVLFPSVLEAGAWMLLGTRWAEKDEKVYEGFVRSLGESGHGNLNRFIKDPKSNPLYGEEDKQFSLSPDCADLPYVLRAYVAYKLRLPFGYVSGISGRGGDQRYSNGNKPTDTKDQDSFRSPQSLFGNVTLVNSGYFRMAPEIQDNDTYPVKIQKESLTPGTIYYDPNGHVGVVYQVTSDGRIRLIDAHPDKSLSRPWFGAKFALGSRNQGGGFRRWRPLWYSGDGHVHRLNNVNIPDFSDTDQYRESFSLGGMSNLSYFDYVRFRLSDKGGRLNPLQEFRIAIQEIYEDMKYRLLAVNICLQDGINKREHPGSLPWNIFGTDGDWEKYSTPSRDARLKVSLRELLLRTQQMIRMADLHDPNLEYAGSGQQLAFELLSLYDGMNPTLLVTYTNSAGNPVTLTFHDVLKRVFLLSFDPFHSVEYRWGATGKELETSRDGPLKQRFYRDEQRLRNQLERLYNVPTSLAMGPETPIDVDVRKWLIDFQQNTVALKPDIPSPYGVVPLKGIQGRGEYSNSAANDTRYAGGTIQTALLSSQANAGVLNRATIQAQDAGDSPMMVPPKTVKNPEEELNVCLDGLLDRVDETTVGLLAFSLASLQKKDLSLSRVADKISPANMHHPSQEPLNSRRN